MAIDTPARHIYSGDGSTRVFPIPTYIQGDDYIRIEINGVHQVDRSKWDIVNNSIIFVTAPITTATIDVQVATSVEALTELGSVTNVDIVAANIVGISGIASNLDEILLTNDNAIIATTKASEALASALVATTKASEALALATSASTSETIAINKAGEASTSASTATNKASEAVASAITASTKASEASTSAISASNSAAASLQSALDSAASAALFPDHIADTINPHEVTKSQVGLGNVDNTADADKVVASAGKLTTSRTISLSGDATGSVSFDGGANVNMTVTVADDSHLHSFANVTNKPTTLAGYSIGDAYTKAETDALHESLAVASSGQSVSYFLDNVITPGGNYALTNSPDGDPETTIAKIAVAANTPYFMERYISDPIGGTTIDGGLWVFRTYASVSSDIGTSEIVSRINKRTIKSGTVTITGTGTSRTITSSDPIFVLEDANSSVLNATLIETPTETFWISAFTSATQVTAITDNSGYINETSVVTYMYYKLFEATTGDINGNTAKLYETKSIQPSFNIVPTDSILIAYFARTTSTNKTLALYKGGTVNYSHIVTPIVYRHNSLKGLNDGEFQHLTAAQLAEINAIISGTNIKTINGLSVLGSGNIVVIDGTSNQSVDGVKTFTSSPIVPTASAQDNSTKVATTAYVDGKMVRATAINSTSGTSIDFTGIPNWVKKVTVLFNGVSTNGASFVQVQLGSTTIQTTGYSGNADNGGGVGVSFTTGMGLERTIDSATSRRGVATFLNITSNVWVGTYVGASSGTNMASGGTAVTLSGTLDRIRITTVNGTDAFDAGSINIMYEG